MNKSINHWNEFIHPRADIIIDLVRIYLGIGLMVKGVHFMWHREELIQLMEEANNLWFAHAGVAHYVVGAHLVGGLFLALGLFTRLAAAVQIPALLGAVFYVALPRLMYWEPRQNFEFSMLVLYLLVLILLFGGGRWSLDVRMDRNLKEESESPEPSSA
jgi:uncharacterized membrane protein YphA (DoxX/SURF4 family)